MSRSLGLAVRPEDREESSPGRRPLDGQIDEKGKLLTLRHQRFQLDAVASGCRIAEGDEVDHKRGLGPGWLGTRRLRIRLCETGLSITYNKLNLSDPNGDGKRKGAQPMP